MCLYYMLNCKNSKFKYIFLIFVLFCLKLEYNSRENKGNFRMIKNNNLENKYLIFKGSGGLAHLLFALDKAIINCQISCRKLIIDTHTHVAFRLHFSEIFVIKNSGILYEDNYNLIPKNIKDEEINCIDIENEKIGDGGNQCRDGYSLFGKNITKNLEERIYSNNNFVFYSGNMVYNKNDKLFQGYYDLHVKDDIYYKLKKEILPSKYISLHFRNTDIKNDINFFINKIKDIKTDIKDIYLASDDFNAFSKLKEDLPNFNIIRKTVPDKNIINLHYSHNNKYEEIYDCLRDIYLILNSEYFIPSINSGLSKMIIKMINNHNYIFPDFNSETTVIY